MTFNEITTVAQQVFEAVCEADGTAWGIYTEDPLTAAAAMIGILNAGRLPVFLPHLQPAFLSAIEDQLDGLVLDHPHSGTGLAVIVARSFSPGPKPLAGLGPWPDQVGFFTSGSTGEPVLISKTLQGLEAEVAALERSFGDYVGDGPVLRTVSHQHIYGFLFCLLWPLMRGRRTSGQILRFPEDVAASLENTGGILVTSPAFLQRATAMMDLPGLAQNCRAIFSSGGPLSPGIAASINAHTPLFLTEVYGSTETGGIAWRRVVKSENPPCWTVFPGIDYRITEAGLEIQSPYLSHQGWHITGDLAEADEKGGFFLKGRADRIVKIEEKRLNLDEMEGYLEQIPDIIKARLVVLDDALRGLIAVVVPSSSGWTKIEVDGKAAFIRQVKHALEARFERVELPRRWRFVTIFPHNSQSKTSSAALKALFSHTHISPVWRDKISDARHWTGDALVDPDLAVLEGHFPGEPIVAGVAQLAWVALQARDALAVAGFTGEMTALKFRRVMQAGCRVELDLRLDSEQGRLEFSFSDDKGLYASGRMQLEPLS